MSVNPVDDSKGWNATNKDINSFNSSIKSCISGVSNMKYCDVSSKATTSAWKIIYQMDYIILMMDINLFIQRLRNV